MKKTLLIVSALVAPALAHAQEGPRPIALNEAVELAKKNAPTMVSARGSLRTNAASLTQAKWALLPTLSISYGSSKNGGGTYVNDQLVAQSNQGYSFSRSLGGLSLTLWDGGSKMGAIHLANANIDAAEATEISAQYSIVQQVKQQYYTILQARETESNARVSLDQTKFQMTLAKARLAAGTATTSDTLTAFVAMTNAQLTIINAQNQQVNANAQLTRLTASQFAVTAIASDTADPSPLAMSDAELFALAEQGPGVKQSAAQYHAAQISEKTSKASYWPQVTLSGSLSQNNRDKQYDFGQGPANYSWGLSLGASYTLWNAYSRESGIIRAKVSTDNAEASLREQKLTVRQNLTQQLGTLHTAEETIKYQRLNIVAGEENLRVVTKRYELGTGLLNDVLSAQSTLNNSKAQLTQARVNARNARAQIEAIIGRELPQ